MAIDTMGQDPGSKAAENIKSVIEAMANAQNAQIELKKSVMLKQIGDKMDIQKNIAQKQANFNWSNSLGGGDTNTPAPTAPTGGSPAGLSPTSGVATGATPATVGIQPPLQGQVAPNPTPQAPPSPTPTIAAGAQRPNQPNLNGIVPPAPTTAGVTAPTAPPLSVQYKNLGYAPVEPAQLVQARRSAGQTINMGDRTYVAALQKVKMGNATSGELAMVNKMNNRTPDGIPQDHPAANAPNIKNGQAHIDTGAGIMKFPTPAQGLKSGALYVDPSDGEIKLNPFYQKQVEAMQTAQAEVAAKAPEWNKDRQDRLAHQAVEDIITKQMSYRNGAIGVSDSKVNQAGSLRQLINSAYDNKTGQYNITQVPYAELSETLGSLLSTSTSGGGSSEARIMALKQATLQGDFNKALSYITGKPSNASSQDAFKQLVGIVDRQGLYWQNLRDSDVTNLKHQVLSASDLEPDRKSAILNEGSIGQSYKELLKHSPDQQIQSGGGYTRTGTLPDGRRVGVKSDGTSEIINGQ